MDTSEQYIKMCDCEEIQGQRHRFEQELAEYSGIWGMRGVYVPPTHLVGNQPKPLIWLPRQDQLQEMVYGDKYYSKLPKNIRLEETSDMWSILPRLLLYAYEWEFTDDGVTLTHNKHSFSSMEQLWLAFVMQTLHSKGWDGSAWVSAN